MNHAILLTHDQLHLLIWALGHIGEAYPDEQDERYYSEEDWASLTSDIDKCLDLSNRLPEFNWSGRWATDLTPKDSNEI